MASQQPYPGLLNAWLSFIRPKTWGVAIAPVIAASALVYLERKTFDITTALATLALALLMQILTNMENDLGYTKRKAEKGNRQGLPRATTNGWISIPEAQNAIIFTCLLCGIDTLYLMWIGGPVFFLIGLLSAIAAYCYMGGPYPIAYTPWGEITVLLFFGLIAVCGTYYLQAHILTFNSLLLGIAIGCNATSVLAVNNWRDREHDASIHRKTLAVVASKPVFTILFKGVMLTPLIISLYLAWNLQAPFLSLPVLLVLFLPKIFKGFNTLSGIDLNKVMFSCVKNGLLYALLFTLGIGLSLLA